VPEVLLGGLGLGLGLGLDQCLKCFSARGGGARSLSWASGRRTLTQVRVRVRDRVRVRVRDRVRVRAP